MHVSLVEQAKRGDREAFNALARERVDGLFATAFRILRDWDAAADATQDALIDAWRHLPGLRQTEKFDGWMYRLVVSRCTRELRRRRRFGSLQLIGAEPSEEADGILALPRRDELKRAFQALSAEHRAVLVLRYYLGWTPAEIAETLGISAGTVSSRLHYGLRATRAALAANERQTEARISG